MPTHVANLIGAYRFDIGLPVEVGGALRHVGEREANNANTALLDAYTLVDAFASILGEPRTVELEFSARF